MKLKINQTTQREIEISIPAYTKTDCHFYKVFSEEKCIQVCTLKGNEVIGVHHAGLAFDGGETVFSTVEEFSTAFESIVNIISKNAM